MTYNADIHRYANDLVKEHGEDAPIHAAMRAHTLLDQGDRSGYALWRRIGSMSNVILSKTAMTDGRVP
ncbi:MAG: hypothetical protein IID48_10690 [Proteobacteria bacterium]|nr:hypothetical protein [Pseudomonadota bacterium]